MSWEDELDEDFPEEKIDDKKKQIFSRFADETEEIVVKKKVNQETLKQKDKPIDYEKNTKKEKKQILI